MEIEDAQTVQNATSIISPTSENIVTSQREADKHEVSEDQTTDERRNSPQNKTKQKVKQTSNYTYKKYVGSFRKKKKVNNSSDEIMKLALAETRNKIGQGLLQLEEVQRGENAGVDEKENMVSLDDLSDEEYEDIITKHPNSTFYLAVAEAARRKAHEKKTKRGISKNWPLLRKSDEDAKAQQSKQHPIKSPENSVATVKKKTKQEKAATDSTLQKLFGGNKKEKEAEKNFKRFEEDFLRIMQQDEEEKWKRVVVPPGQKKRAEDKAEKTIPENGKHKPKTNKAETKQKEELFNDFKASSTTSKGYIATLPRRLSKKKKKVAANLAKDDGNLSSASQSLENQHKQNKSRHSMKKLLKPTQNKIFNADMIVEILDEQDKEQKWKSVVLTKRQLAKREEERKEKLKRLEEEKMKMKMKEERLKEEALQIKLMEEAESSRREKITPDGNERLQLTVQRAFVVKNSNLDIKNSSSMQNLTRKLSMRLRRTASARFSPRSKSDSYVSGDSSPTSSTRGNQSRKWVSLRSPGNGLDIHQQAKNRHRSTPGGDAAAQNHSAQYTLPHSRSASKLHYGSQDEKSGNAVFSGEKSPKKISRSPTLVGQHSEFSRREEALRTDKNSRKSRKLHVSSIQRLNQFWRELNNKERHLLKRKTNSGEEYRRSRSLGSAIDNLEDLNRFDDESESRYASRASLRSDVTGNLMTSSNGNAIERRKWRAAKSGFATARVARAAELDSGIGLSVKRRDLDGSSEWSDVSSLGNITDRSTTSVDQWLTRSNTNVNSSTRWRRSKMQQAGSLPSFVRLTDSPGSLSDLHFQATINNNLRNKRLQLSEINKSDGSVDRHFYTIPRRKERHHEEKVIYNDSNSRQTESETNVPAQVDSNRDVSGSGNTVANEKSITMADISSTLQIAEEHDPIVTNFNQMQNTLNQHQRPEMEKTILNQSTKETPPVENHQATMEGMHDHHICHNNNPPSKAEQLGGCKRDWNETNMSQEWDCHRRRIRYKRTLQIQHESGSPSVPYVAAARNQDQSMFGKNNFYTTDSNTESMYVYSFKGKLKQTISVPGCPRGLTSLTSSHVLCTSCSDGHIYVIDVARSRIVRNVSHRATLKNPRYVAVHPNNRAYMTSDIRCLGNWNISMYDMRSGVATAFLASSNQQSKISMKWPGFFTFRPDSEQLFISDSESNRVFVYDVRSLTEPLLEIGKTGCGDGQLQNPCGVAFIHGNPCITSSGAGLVTVADWGNNRISSFDVESGQFHGHVIKNVEGRKSVLETPYDLSSDSSGCLYVSESETNRVKLFRPIFVTT